MTAVVQTPDGDVHAMSPIGGGEHTLCGIAIDAADSERDERLRLSATRRRAVSCAMCADVVLACRQLRVARR